MKKYYYKDQLVRTSEREYEYAVIIEKEDGTICTMSCNATRVLAEKELNRILHMNRKDEKRMNFLKQMKVVEIEAR